MHLYFFPYGDMSNWKWGGEIPSLEILCAVSERQLYHTGLGKSDHSDGLLLPSGVIIFFFF